MVGRLAATVGLVLVCIAGSAQDQLFKRYENTKGVSTVYISPAMFRLMPKKKVGDKDIVQIASRLDKLQILECERPSLIAAIKREALAYYRKNRYEVVMQMKDDDERVTVYQRTIGKGKNEFVLFNEEEDELSIIQVVGNVSLDEIKHLND